MGWFVVRKPEEEPAAKRRKEAGPVGGRHLGFGGPGV